MGSRSRAFVAALLTVSMFFPGILPALSVPAEPSSAMDDIENGAPARGRAVERPDHNGPWGNAGFMYYRFTGSTKDYDIGVKMFYPASASGENTTPDGSGAPYPVLVMLPPMGGPEESYNGNAGQIVSWGYVCVVVGPNWSDFGNSGNSTDINEILDYVEAANATSGHNLYRMIDHHAVGIMGYSSGGGLAVIDAALVDRIISLVAFAPAISDSTLDILSQFFQKPFQFQAGDGDAYYGAHAIHGYNVFPPPKAFLNTRNGSHGGPFFWDCVISFCQRYLRGDTNYETFLYGDEAINDMARNKYALNFRLENGSFFPPAISASSSASSVDENGVVDFNATWTGLLPLGHPLGAFKWDFDGDGTADSSDAFNPAASWRFTGTGLQKVGMWYGLGEYAINGTGSLYVDVRNLPPRVVIGPDHSAAEDEPLQFSAEASDTSGLDEPIMLAWDFGDGISEAYSGSVSATHAYTKAGNYTLRVTARDPDGATASARGNVSIRNLPPVVTARVNATVLKDSSAFFNGTMQDTPSDVLGLQCRWEFGDGLSTDWGTETAAEHTYTRSGNFTASFLVVDGDRSLATATVDVAVENEAPLAAITGPDPGSMILKDREVAFSGRGRDTATDGPTLQYSWDFGDGNLTEWSFSSESSHTYTRSGNVSVRLRVRDGEGAVGESSLAVTIGNQPPRVRLLAPTIYEVDEDRPVRFQAAGEDTESDQPLLNYTWVIGNETYYGDTVQVAFTTAGVGAYRVIVRDPDGAESGANGSLEVFNPAPALSAELSPLLVFENGTVNFTASAADSVSDRPALRYLWRFGDGAESNASSGTHVFARAGTYNVKVTVHDDEGGSDERTFSVTVQARPAPPRPTGDGEAGSDYPMAMAAGAVAAVALIALVAALALRKRK